MAFSQYKLRIEPLGAEPKGLSWFEKGFYQRSGKPAFIVGKTFQASFRYSNIGERPFPSGKLVISLHWSNGIIVNVPIELSSFQPGDENVFTFENEGIVSPGYSLFNAFYALDYPLTEINNEGKPTSVNILPVYRDETSMINPQGSFFSIYAQTSEEFYQYWAMILATIGLCYPIIKQLLGEFVNWILLYLFFIEFVSRLWDK